MPRAGERIALPCPRVCSSGGSTATAGSPRRSAGHQSPVRVQPPGRRWRLLEASAETEPVSWDDAYERARQRYRRWATMPMAELGARVRAAAEAVQADPDNREAMLAFAPMYEVWQRRQAGRNALAALGAGSGRRGIGRLNRRC